MEVIFVNEIAKRNAEIINQKFFNKERWEGLYNQPGFEPIEYQKDYVKSIIIQEMENQDEKYFIVKVVVSEKNDEFEFRIGYNDNKYMEFFVLEDSYEQEPESFGNNSKSIFLYNVDMPYGPGENAIENGVFFDDLITDKNNIFGKFGVIPKPVEEMQ